MMDKSVLDSSLDTAPENHGHSSLLQRVRSLPVVSWVIGDRDSAAAGAGCGLVGGACCAGGAVLTGLGISSSAAVSAFIGDTQLYFIGASVLMMGAWIFCAPNLRKRRS